MFPQDAAGHQDLDVNDDDDDYNDKYVDNGDCNGDGEGDGDVDDFEGDHANDDHSNIVKDAGQPAGPTGVCLLQGSSIIIAIITTVTIVNITTIIIIKVNIIFIISLSTTSPSFQHHNQLTMSSSSSKWSKPKESFDFFDWNNNGKISYGSLQVIFLNFALFPLQ